MKSIGKIVLVFAAVFLLAMLPAGLMVPHHVYQVAAVLAIADMSLFIYYVVTGKDESVAYNTLTLTKIFMKEITKNFYKDNGWLAKSKNDTSFVVNGREVLLPQRGSRPEVIRELNEFPATVGKRVDTEESYQLKPLYVRPIHIEDVEELEVSYDKRNSIREDIEMELKQAAAQYILETWMPQSGAKVIEATGSDRAAGYTGASGDRKATTRADIVSLAEFFDKDDLPQAGRQLMIPASMLSDVRKIDEFMSAEKIGSTNLIEGQIGRVFGMDIFTRSTLVPYTGGNAKVNANNKGAYSITAATVKDSALAWHSQLVRHALGQIKININVNAPGYYGTILDGFVRFGGRQSRADGKGAYTLVEG